MAAGLGFKTFTTGEVLTAADTNGYLMQGVNVFADAAARTAAITSPEEGQMSFLKDTNSTEYYSGSAWTPVSAGGGDKTLAQIATGTLSGASVTVSSLSTYDTLILAVYSTTNSTANGITKVRVNNNSTGNYQTFGFYTDQNYNATVNDGVYINPNTIDRAVNANAAIIKFTNCKSAGFTDFDLSSRVYTGTNQVASFAGVYTVAEAVSSLVILNTGGNWAGGTYTVWGG
jgi:hypothetical protein